jgi:hypothetical protein
MYSSGVDKALGESEFSNEQVESYFDFNDTCDFF